MTSPSSRARSLACGALAVLVLGGLPACGTAEAGTPSTPSATAVAQPGARTSPAPQAPVVAPVATGILPTRVRIPTLGVDAPVLPNGLNPDGTVGVPSLDQIGDVNWYDGSARPGEAGRVVLLGHVDGRGKPGVFVNLRTVPPGTEVTVAAADGRTVRYRVTLVQSYLKSQFPTELVYGDSTEHEIRLVTCGGRFDRAAQSYESNIIAFGTEIKETTHS